MMRGDGRYSVRVIKDRIKSKLDFNRGIKTNVILLRQNFIHNTIGEKKWLWIYTDGNPVVVQPASDQHVLLNRSLLPTIILLTKVRSVLANLLLYGRELMQKR